MKLFMLIFVGKQLKTEKQLIRPLLFEVKLEISRLDIEPFSNLEFTKMLIPQKEA